MIAPTPLSTSVKSSVTMSFISTTSAFTAFLALKNSWSCWTFAPRATLISMRMGQASSAGDRRDIRSGYARADWVAGFEQLDEDVRAYEPRCAGDLPVSGSFRNTRVGM